MQIKVRSSTTPLEEFFAHRHKIFQLIVPSTFLFPWFCQLFLSPAVKARKWIHRFAPTGSLTLDATFSRSVIFNWSVVRNKQKTFTECKYGVHISLFLGIKIKDKFPLSSPKFSRQRNINCMKERRNNLYQKKKLGYLQYYSFHCSTRCSSSQHIHHQCLKSIRFLYFSQDHLQSTIGIICDMYSSLRPRPHEDDCKRKR